MRAGTRIAAAGACLAILATDCSRSPTLPAADSLRGDVRTTSNATVSGAVVEVRYTLVDPAAAAAAGSRSGPTDIPPVVPAPPFGRSFSVSNNPCELGGAAIRLGLPIDGHCTIRVLDRAGTVRRVLADRTFAAGLHLLLWDGHDDADQPLPANLYVVTWKDVEGDSVFEFSAKVLWHPVDPNQGANTTTLANGSFAIPLDEFPIGDWFEARSVEDSLLGTRVVTWPITVVASAMVNGVVRTGQTVVDEARRKDRVPVVLH